MRRILLIIFLLSPFVLPAQNLVVNPEFRISNQSDDRVTVDNHGPYFTFRGDSMLARGWAMKTSCTRLFQPPKDPTIGYNASDPGTLSTCNSCQLQLYIRNSDKHMYIQGTLSTPLEKDSLYCISMFMHFGFSEYRMESMQVFFSDTETPIPANLDCIPQQPQVEIDSLESTSLFYAFGCVSGYYRAQGGERFFTIGNFMDKDHMDTVVFGDRGVYPLNRNDGNAIYGISNVNVSPYHGTAVPTLPEIFSKLNVGAIRFPLRESRIQDQSLGFLSEVINTMKEQSALHIDLHGFTDSTGLESNNQLLSEQRAKAVADYLVANGIDSSRIMYSGYASSQPVFRRARTQQGTDVKEYNPELSRRVEFLLVRPEN